VVVLGVLLVVTPIALLMRRRGTRP
jgi:hypothetical protein